MNIIVAKMNEISLTPASQPEPVADHQQGKFVENISYPDMLADQQCADMLAADSVAEDAAAADAHTSTDGASRPKRACRERTATVSRLSQSHRKVMKKSSFKTTDPTASKLSDITKIYSKQTLSKFRPTNLETVYEEDEQQPPEGGDPVQQQPEGGDPVQQQHHDLRQQVRLVGLKKVRRTLICKNGSDCNKAVLKKRRDKVKRNNLPRHRKISMDNFMSHMHALGASEERDSGGNEPDAWNASGGDGTDEADSSAAAASNSFDANLMANLQKLANVKPPTA